MIYLTRKAVSTGGQNSSISVEGSDLNMATNIPVEMGGKKTGGTNPEELFVAGIIGCLTRSFEFLARNKQVQYTDIQVLGQVFLEDDSVQGGFKFRLLIEFQVKGIDEKEKDLLIRETIAFCPFSRAVKNNIEIEYIIK